MEKVSDGVSERFLPPPPVAAIALGNEWPHCPCSSLQTSDDRMARAGLYPPDLLSTHLATLLALVPQQHMAVRL